jgi:hypothetical protein
VSKLILQIDPKLGESAGQGTTASIADFLADAVLRHPMIGHEGNMVATKASDMIMGAINEKTKGILPGTVVEREELVRILLEIAGNEGPLSGDRVPEPVRSVLQSVLMTNGVTDAQSTLREIRAKRIDMEKNYPQLSQAVWHAQAVMAATASDFVGKVNSWFDNSMDRVTARFALMAKTVTTIVALAFVVTVQLDVRDLISRLWADNDLRREFVQQAESYQKRVDDSRMKAEAAATADAKAEATTQAAEDQERWNKVQESLADMRVPGLQLIPNHLVWEGVARTRVTQEGLARAKTPLRLVVDGLNYPLRLPEAAVGTLTAPQVQAEIARLSAPVRTDTSDGLMLIAKDYQVNLIRLESETAAGVWSPISTELDRAFDWSAIGSHFWGVLFAWVLVSLGAPFWYDALKNLLKFRSLVAQKEDKSREERNTTQVRMAQTPAKSPDEPPPERKATVTTA